MFGITTSALAPKARRKRSSRHQGRFRSILDFVYMRAGGSTVTCVSIHPTAVVNSRAHIGADVVIGPYAVIEDGVIIGDGCEIGAHAVVKRYTTLGERNRVFEHATLGGEPQDLKYRGES